MPNWNFCFLGPDVAKSLPCWLSQFRKAELRQPTGQRLSHLNQKFQLGHSYWFHGDKSWFSKIQQIHKVNYNTYSFRQRFEINKKESITCLLEMKTNISCDNVWKSFQMSKSKKNMVSWILQKYERSSLSWVLKVWWLSIF